MRATRTAYNLFKSAGVTGSSNEANNIKQIDTEGTIGITDLPTSEDLH
jgi:hypothetical protein